MATPSDSPPHAAVAQDARKKEGRRKRLLLVAALVFVLAGLAWAAWYWMAGRWYESTDDAYVAGNVVQITPQQAGTVVAVAADDTERVREGQLLVRLDDTDARVALREAEANLARTVRQVRTLFASSGQSNATVAARRSDLARARADLERRERLAGIGAVSQEELQHAREAVSAAKAALEAAGEQRSASRALVDRTTVAAHPDVQAAAARLHEAYVALARTRIPAPLEGMVARRTVQVGQRVAPGASLMVVVPLARVWVDANFKENQLGDLRLGQPAKLVADVYGDAVTFHGRIVGFAPGTGAAFALLPAQNATGNWIKVVQRLPVRVALDPKELAEHPLQVGLSMQVEVDTHARGGGRLPEAGAAPGAPQQTRVFERLNAQADERVAQIIAANAPPDVKAAPPRSSAPRHGRGR